MQEVFNLVNTIDKEHMTNKIDQLRIPVKLWINKDEIESGALEQIYNLANLPFAYHHVAIMPDTHQGYGMPIGGVIATDGVVIPNAVGVDIGCGMCAINTGLKVENLKDGDLKQIMSEIRKYIPLGFNHHKDKQDEALMPDKESYLYGDKTSSIDIPIINQEYNSALKQIGTLGGGNHFIEIQKDENDFIWIMIHSGSRNLGKKVADHYNKIAINLNEKYHSKVDKKLELAFLPLDSDEGNSYLMEMQYCVDFALASRKLMMDRIMAIFYSIVSGVAASCKMINIAHNYASMENHFGKNVMIHRKGATLARESTIGIIPGSQGTKSYIVQGKGNVDSFMSCSHGAGRKMSRNKAEENLNLEDEIKRLDDQGIIHGIRHKSDLDEAAGAYKDIDKVMEYQKDLVDILTTLTPMAVIKG